MDVDCRGAGRNLTGHRNRPDRLGYLSATDQSVVVTTVISKICKKEQGLGRKGDAKMNKMFSFIYFFIIPILSL